MNGHAENHAQHARAAAELDYELRELAAQKANLDGQGLLNQKLNPGIWDEATSQLSNKLALAKVQQAQAAAHMMAEGSLDADHRIEQLQAELAAMRVSCDALIESGRLHDRHPEMEAFEETLTNLHGQAEDAHAGARSHYLCATPVLYALGPQSQSPVARLLKFSNTGSSSRAATPGRANEIVIEVRKNWVKGGSRGLCFLLLLTPIVFTGKCE